MTLRALAMIVIVSGSLGGPAAVLAQDRPALMASIFSDHGVLQRDRPISVWGRAVPGEVVLVTLGSDRVEAWAAADGAWRAILPARRAGGPHTLTAMANGVVQTASDVMIGDVWLCSGQSNMALPIVRALNAPIETARSSDDGLRLLTIPRGESADERTEFAAPLAWTAAGPETVGAFSAACFHFGQDLRRDHDVPMGLIVAARGGTMIQPWMSRAALRSVGDHDADLMLLDAFVVNEPAAQARFVERWQDWWRTFGDGEPWRQPSGVEWLPVPRMGAWERWGADDLQDFDGLMWFRTTVQLNPGQAVQAGELILGNVDDADVTWVNGRPLAASGQGEQTYSIAAGTLNPGENSVVVSVWDGSGDGGLLGPAGSRVLTLADGTRLDLDVSGWRYRRAEAQGDPRGGPRAPWDPRAGTAMLHNAMIAPLRDYGLKGVLWYQGESNARWRTDRYQAWLSALMRSWRDQFADPSLPVLIVSLPGHGAPPTQPTSAAWAELREGMRRAVLNDDNAGLAVAIDLGDRWDIHPGQKKEVGRRLARAARAVAYSEDVAQSGPEVTSARLEDDAVVLDFSGVTGGLVTYSGDLAVGFELCRMGGADCRYVQARVDGATVTLSVPADFAPAEVRYAWADSPVVTLFDAAGLPAGPFRLTLD